VNNDPCLREGDVLRAATSDHWTADLRAHVADCDSCEQVHSVALLMATASADDDTSPLPDPGDIWWKARWLAGQEARQRAMRPVDTLERSEPLVALVLVAALLAWRGDALMAGFFSWAAGDAAAPALQVLMPPAMLPFVIVGAGLCALVLVVGMGTVLARD